MIPKLQEVLGCGGAQGFLVEGQGSSASQNLITSMSSLVSVSASVTVSFLCFFICFSRAFWFASFFLFLNKVVYSFLKLKHFTLKIFLF